MPSAKYAYVFWVVEVCVELGLGGRQAKTDAAEAQRKQESDSRAARAQAEWEAVQRANAAAAKADAEAAVVRLPPLPLLPSASACLDYYYSLRYY